MSIRNWFGWSILVTAAAIVLGMLIVSIGPLGTVAVVVFTVVLTAMILAGTYLISQ